MDMNKWKEYEEKKKALRKSFARQRLVAWLVWLIIAVAMNTVLVLLEKKIGVQIMFTVMLILNAFALFIVCRKNAELKNHMLRQIDIIEQDEPFGRFKTGE